MKKDNLYVCMIGYAITATIMLIGIIWATEVVSPNIEKPSPIIETIKSGIEHEQASPVYVGYYLNSINAYKNDEKNFHADFYLWFRWQEKLGELLPFEFMNSIAEPTISNETAPEQFCSVFENDIARPCTTHDIENRWQYRVYRISGDFIYGLSLQKYPFDEQTLSIQLELSQHMTDQAYLVPDGNSYFPEQLDITGWFFRGASLTSQDVTYRTNFGIPAEKSANQLKYSGATLEVKVARTPLPYVLKTLVPLLIIVFIGSLALFLPPDIQGARFGLCTGALLSTIALHLTVSSSLPNVGYSTIMDKCFINAYLHIGWLTVQSVIIGMIEVKGHKSTLLIDRISYILFPVTFLIGYLIAIDIFSVV